MGRAGDVLQGDGTRKKGGGKKVFGHPGSGVVKKGKSL